jgi:DNA (cytosine-5)-methyltransferase 1
MSRRAISLFSGAGGDTLGLERAGYKVVAFSEMNKAAIETHLANFPESVHLRAGGLKGADITQVPDSVFEPYAGQIDVVFAGFPCQGFSKAGKKKATDTRNQLFRQFVRVVKIVKPRRIIGENVPGLLNMASGPAETDPPMIEVIRQAFQEIGYAFEHRVVEATEFGVPQKRKRLLMVGAPVGDPMLATMPAFWQQMEAWGSAQPMPKLRSFTGAHLIGALALKPGEVPEGFDSVALTVGAEAGVTGTPHPYVALKAGQKLLSCSKRASPIHSEVVNLDKPSKTIICTYDHQPRLLVGLKRGEERWVRTMTPDELKQIQGFPADYMLRGNLKEQIVQVGNAAPPALVEAVARHF